MKGGAIFMLVLALWSSWLAELSAQESPPPPEPESESESERNLDQFLPSRSQLFEKAALDEDGISKIDCHLRNVDFCYAGLLASSTKPLPENDQQLETRCDELRTASSCIGVFNDRCHALKVFEMLAPFSRAVSGSTRGSPLVAPERQLASSAPEGLLEQQLPPDLLAQVGGGGSTSGPNTTTVSVRDLVAICEPAAKTSEANRILRSRLFVLAQCINKRIPTLQPCFSDLKTALQIFYEPSRVLPLKPSCCAIGRFRSCAIEALDNVCGLSSFKQLAESMSSVSGSAGPASMLATVERVCKEASDFRAPYCRDLLPPAGVKAPARRGSRASKLARALDLLQFSPAMQTAR